MGGVIPGSSMVEQEAVNFEVTGSSPVRGATESLREIEDFLFCYHALLSGKLYYTQIEKPLILTKIIICARMVAYLITSGFVFEWIMFL